MVNLVRIPDTPRPEVYKYYICCDPYPNKFNDQKDYITFARWIASILGNTIPLHAIYYKPEASDKVIFAVNKAYQRFERLLGEHRWNEFLKKPKGDEVGLKSRIFNCTYVTDRDLQKDDWKRISVEDNFFINWGIRKWLTKVPYPTPHPLPEITEKPLYRPIPTVRVFLGPPASPGQRVVGSSNESKAPNETTRMNASINLSQQTRIPGVTKRPGIQKTNTAANQSLQPAVPALPRKKFFSDDELSSVGLTANHAKSRAVNGTSSAPLSATRAPAPIPQVKLAAANPLKYVKNKVESLDRTRAINNNKIPAPDSMGARQSQRSRSSSPSSGYTTGSTTASAISSGYTTGRTTASAVSSAPSFPVPSSSVQDQELVYIDISKYENDYDEEITEETCYGNWEITNVPVPSDPLTPMVHSGDSAELNGRAGTHPLVESVKRETGPVDLWRNLKPIIRPTGSMTAVEAKAKEDKKALCPVHKGKCRMGICVAYKEMLKSHKKQENVARKKVKKEQERGKKDEEKNPGWKKDGEKRDPGKDREKTGREKKDPGSKDREKDGEKKDPGSKDREKDRGRDEQKKDPESKEKEDPGEKKVGEKEGEKHNDVRKVMDEKATAGNEADNKRVKEDFDQSSKRNGQEKSRPWDEYTSDEDDIDDFPSFLTICSKPSAKKFYDDEEFFN